MKIYIYTTIAIICFIIILYILIYRKYKNSGPDKKPEIQRTLSDQLKNSTQNLLQSDSVGNLSIAPSWPVVGAYLSVPQAIRGDNSIVIFNMVEFDTANCFNTSTGAYTPNVAGYYQINASVYYEMNSPPGAYQIYLLKNGKHAKRGAAASNSASGRNIGLNISAVVLMNGTTDSVQILTIQTTGTTVNLCVDNGTLTWFNAIMIRPP